MSKLPKNWKEVNLVDCLESLIDYRGKTPKKSDSGILTLSAKSVKMGYIDYNQAYYISQETYDKFMVRGFPKKGDVLMTTEAPLGCIAKLDRDDVSVAQRLLTLRGKENILDNNYLLYYLTSKRGQYELNSRASGSTVQGIKRSEFEYVKIVLPNTYEEQKAIAKILSSFDNKIELLKEQNKTLETMVQTVFKEWFVDDEDTKSYLFKELIDSISVKHNFNNEKVIFLNTSDIYDGKVLHNQYSNIEGLPGQAKKSIQKNDILFTEIRPANKRFAYIDFEANDYVVSTKLMVLRSKNIIDTSILYSFLKLPYTLKYLQILAESRSGTFPQITFEHVQGIEIFVPKNKLLLNNVTNLFKNIINKTLQNNKSIQILQKTRDTLLPKLMSGNLRVKGFEND